MNRVPLLFPFLLALFATLYASVFFTHCHLHTFVPFLALLFCRCSRLSSFWIGSLCGLILDILSSETRFGIHALSFAGTTLLLYNQKKHFYEDKPLALSLFTFQLSLIVTILFFIGSLMGRSTLSLDWKWIISDFILMPAFDSLYAFLWFSCPMLLYRHIKSIGIRVFFRRLLFTTPPTNEHNG